MNPGTAVTSAAGTTPPAPARRADAGTVRLGDRDIAGLLLCGDMYGAPYDLLAGFLGVRADRARGIVARWRHARYADTGRLGPGPAWCWLTRTGLTVTGLDYTATRPALGRLAHIRAVLAVRLSLQASDAYQDGHGWWRSERRIRAAIGARVGTGGHVPDAEVSWPDLPASPYAGECCTRATFDAAQDTAATKAGSRDGDDLSGHAFTRRSYVLRSRLRCRDCRRRMHGITRPSSRYYTTGPDASYTYYVCPHDAAKPRLAALAPDHPRSVSVREDALLTVVHQMFRERIFGPERAALLAALIPANAAAEAAHRDKQTATLRKRLRQIDASENAQAREIEALAHVGDPHSRAVTAMRTRHLARFTELEDERAQADAQLAALAKTTHDTPDPSLLDRLPMLGDLITEAPIRLQRRLYEAFDLQLLYNKHLHQVTIWATITPTTPGTLAAIINDSDDGHPAASNPPAGPATGTSHPEFSDPLPSPICQ